MKLELFLPALLSSALLLGHSPAHSQGAPKADIACKLSPVLLGCGPDTTKVLPNDAVYKVVNSGLISWTRVWDLTPYMLGSTTVGRRSIDEDGDIRVTGTFAIATSSPVIRMVYAAMFTKGSEGYMLESLCYEEPASKEHDYHCINTDTTIEARVAQLEQYKKDDERAARVARLAARRQGRVAEAAKTDRQRVCRTEYSYASPGVTGYEDNGAMGRGIPYQICE